MSRQNPSFIGYDRIAKWVQSESLNKQAVKVQWRQYHHTWRALGDKTIVRILYVTDLEQQGKTAPRAGACARMFVCVCVFRTLHLPLWPTRDCHTPAPTAADRKSGRARQSEPSTSADVFKRTTGVHPPRLPPFTARSTGKGGQPKCHGGGYAN